MQRLTALYIMVFLLMFAFVWGGETITFNTWRAWAAHPAANIALLLFVFSILMHAWIGGRDVVIDYIKSVAARYVLLITFALGLIILGLWSMRMLISVSAL